MLKNITQVCCLMLGLLLTPLAQAEWVDISPSVEISKTNQALDRINKVLYSYVTVKNSSGTAITGPLHLKIINPNVPVLNSAGLSEDFQNYLVINDDLAAGAVKTVRVNFQQSKTIVSFGVQLAKEQNKAPTANAQSVIVAANNSIIISLSGHDADGDTLTFAMDSLPSRGSLSAIDGHQVTYVPTAGHDGSDSFTFKVNDGKTHSVPARVSIDITPSDVIPPVRELIPEDKMTLSSGETIVRGELLISKEDDATHEEMLTFINAQGWTLVGHIPELDSYQVDTGLTDEAALKQALDTANASPLVFEAFYNRVMAPQAFYTDDAKYDNFGDEDWWALDAIQADDAWKLLYGGKAENDLPGVSIGVLDGGFKSNHEDLQFREILPTIADTEWCHPKSFLDTFFDFYDNKACENANHGMHVAGIISATGNNGKGIAGVAYKNPLNPIAIRTSFSDASKRYGLWTLVKKGVQVINMSFGYTLCDEDFCRDLGEEFYAKTNRENARQFADLLRINPKVLFVQSSGNFGDRVLGDRVRPLADVKMAADLNGTLASLFSPEIDVLKYCETKFKHRPVTMVYCKKVYKDNMALVSGHALIVGAFKNTDPYSITDYTQKPLQNPLDTGEYPFILAPGGIGTDAKVKTIVLDTSNPYFPVYKEKVDPFSPTNKDIESTVYQGKNEYAPNAGTSMAAPHVTGVVALVWQANPDLSATEVQKIIMDSAKEHLISGYPALNANRAVEMALAKLKSSEVTQSILFEGDNYSIGVSDDSYVYKNGKHYIAWSLNAANDNKVKLSTSVDGVNWTTVNIFDTQYGSYNHKVAVSDSGVVHVVFNITANPGTYGNQSINLVHIHNSNGSFQEVLLHQGSNYQYYTASKLFFTADGVLNLFHQKDGWYRYNAPLYEQNFDGNSWTTNKLVSNLAYGRGDPDDFENILLAHEIVNGKKVLYVSSGFWRAVYAGEVTYSGHLFKYTENASGGYDAEEISSNGTNIDVKNGNIVYASIDKQAVFFNNQIFYDSFAVNETVYDISYDDVNNKVAVNTYMNSNGVYTYKAYLFGADLILETEYNDFYVFVKNGLLFKIQNSKNPKRFLVEKK